MDSMYIEQKYLLLASSQLSQFTKRVITFITFVVHTVVILTNLKQRLVDTSFVKNRNYYIDVITVQKVLPFKDFSNI